MSRFLVIVALISCAGGADGLEALRTAELRLAGPHPVVCGVVPLKSNSDLVDSCVVGAFESKKPFIARYEIQGFDSQVVESLVGNARGQVFTIHYDSNICGTTRRMPGCGSRITDSVCRNAAVIEKAGSRRLLCRPTRVN